MVAKAHVTHPDTHTAVMWQSKTAHKTREVYGCRSSARALRLRR